MTTDKPRGARERILAAAVEILVGGDVTARLSVRAVATRAQVSVGSLRHHFPTQRALRDAALQSIYDVVIPSAPIDDASVPADERLLASLRTILDTGGHGSQARATLASLVETFVAVEQTEQLRDAYFAVMEEGLRRIEGWLTTLAAEGELAPDSVAERAHFLGTVLNGLTMQRALPSPDNALALEEQTLRFAVRAALGPR